MKKFKEYRRQKYVARSLSGTEAKKIMGKLSNLKLAEKMILVYVLMLGIYFLISVAALQISFNIYDSKLYEKSLQELNFFIQEINRNLDKAEEISYNIAMDARIQEQLTKIKSLKPFSAEYFYEFYQLRMLLNNKWTAFDLLSNIMYTDGGQTPIVAGLAVGTISPEMYEAMMNKACEARGAYVWQSPTAEYPYLLGGREIRKYADASLEYMGTLLITYDISGVIEQSIKDLESENLMFGAYAGKEVIYENHDGLTEWLPQLSTTKGYQIVKANGQRYFVCHLKSVKTGWLYVNAFPYSEIYGFNQTLRYVMIGIFLLLFLLSAWILNRLAHRLVKPLKRLSESMQIVETGDFKGAREVLGNHSEQDEISRITQEFKITLDKIDNLIHENYEKQLLLKDTKYKMLQAQINPHFLYNTLNSIHWMIRAKKNEEAAEMTVALGVILRSALSRQQYVSIDEELESLKKYMTIQEYRYGKRVIFSVVCEASGRYLIPHMTLQPLVENSIYHGVEKMLTPCTIAVIIQEEENGLLIAVTDNGPGMTEEELAAVRSFTAEVKGHGIGLKNIYERLKTAFDQRAGFTISSICGQGTTVTIRIPKTEVMESND